MLSNEVPNNCCNINGDIVMVANFVKMSDGSMNIVGRKYLTLNDLFDEPCASSNMGIYIANNLSALCAWDLKDSIIKCMCLPLHNDKDGHAILPLSHTVPTNDEGR